MKISFLERNLSRFTTLLEESLFAEEAAAKKGWLQQIDARVKLISFLALLLSAAFSRNLIILASIYALVLLLAAGSSIFTIGFIRRVWLFMPLYTAMIALPALFITPGERLIEVPALQGITREGIEAASFLILRVATSISLMLTLVLTTSWPVLLKALRSVGIPKVIVVLLSMTYRYLYVLLHTVNNMFLARKSRRIGIEPWVSLHEWTGTLLGTLLGKSYQISTEVHLAMIARGYRGEPVILTDFKMTTRDWLWMFFLCGCAATTFYLGYWIKT